jgi:hypothetical protein
MLQAVLSVANEEQSALYPPSIFSTHYNIVTSFLLDRCVQLYPEKPFVLDIIDPYVGYAMQPVNNGLVTLPDDYRNILGSPYVFANPKNNGSCESQPEINNQIQFQAAMNRSSCRVNPLEIVSQAEFSIRTNSTYNYPTWEYPIAYFTGKKTLKVCPFDIPKIFFLYTQQEGIYQLAYLPNPDDTWNYDPKNTVDGNWNNSAFKSLFKGLCHLYSAYVRDQEIKEWSNLLSQIDIV